MDVAEVRELASGLPVGDILGALAAVDSRPSASMRAIAEAPGATGMDGYRRRALLLGTQVERSDVRRTVGVDVDLADRGAGRLAPRR